MFVEASPNVIVRLWPKLPCAAEPASMIDVRFAAPMALVASATTVLASCACAGVNDSTHAKRPAVSGSRSRMAPPSPRAAIVRARKPRPSGQSGEVLTARSQLLQQRLGFPEPRPLAPLQVAGHRRPPRQQPLGPLTGFGGAVLRREEAGVVQAGFRQ